MNIRLNSPQKKSRNILANEFICPKYLNIFEYQNICSRLFWNYLTILIFCVLIPKLNHFGPLLTILNHFWGTMKLKYIHYHWYWKNEYPNLLVSINRSQMNIQIYWAWKKSTNIRTNEYIFPNIFTNIWISEYLSHTAGIRT